jgi:hypothetical protein
MYPRLRVVRRHLHRLRPRPVRLLDRQSRARGAIDATHYGTARASHRRFYAHHLAAISAAIAHADALSVFTDAAHTGTAATSSP